MLRWAFFFLVFAALGGALEMFPMQGISSEIGWMVFVVLLSLFVASLLPRVPLSDQKAQ